MMKVMYSSLLEDELIIVGQTSTFVCVCVFATGFSSGLSCGPSPWDAAFYTV